MSKNTKAEAENQRREIVRLINEGKSYSQIEKELTCSRRTIAKVKQAMYDPEQDPIEDKRESNGSTPIADHVRTAVIELRKETGLGSLMLWAMMHDTPEEYGLTFEEVPAPSTMGRWLNDAEMTVRMTGSKDRKFYPYEMAHGHGDLMMMDGWGPHHLTKSTKVYLATIKDHYSRQFSAVINIADKTHKGADSDQWISAYYHGVKHFYGGAAPAVLQTDNGIGLAIVKGHLPQTARHALRAGSRLVYIPKAQPWRNGRLENTHWRMEVEFWRRPKMKNVTSASEVTERLAKWLSFYNVKRPFTNTSNKEKLPPARRADGYIPVMAADIQPGQHAHLEPQTGIMDCIRLVETRGHIDLWAGDNVQIQQVFAGQYVRLRFYIEPGKASQYGEIIWRSNHQDEPVIVATFNHKVERSRRANEKVITDIVYSDFQQDKIAAHGVRLDQMQLNNQIARITKRPHRTGGDDFTEFTDEE